MSIFWKLFAALMVLLPIVTLAIWWEDGAWQNGAMTTKGFYSVLGCCSAALVMMGLSRWLKNRQTQKN